MLKSRLAERILLFSGFIHEVSIRATHGSYYIEYLGVMGKENGNYYNGDMYTYIYI